MIKPLKTIVFTTNVKPTMAPSKKRKINTKEKSITENSTDEQYSDNEDLIDLANPNPTTKDVWKLMIKIHQSQEFLANKFDTFNHQTKLIEQENKELKNEVTQLKTKLTQVEGYLNNFHQELYSKHFTVSNIPTDADENLENIVTKIANSLKINITPNNIVATKRLRTPKQQQASNEQKKITPPEILVELNSVTIKQQFLDNAKKSGPLTTNQLQIQSGSTATKIYINEVLSGTNKKILYEAQSLKKKYNIKYVWAKNGFVFLRHEENQIPIRINSLEHLQQIDKQMKETMGIACRLIRNERFKNTVS